jgi:hexokinase
MEEIPFPSFSSVLGFFERLWPKLFAHPPNMETLDAILKSSKYPGSLTEDLEPYPSARQRKHAYLHRTSNQSSRAGSFIEIPRTYLKEIEHLEQVFSVSTAKLKEITDRFQHELERGLSVEGGTVPMNPTWVMSTPTGYETGTYLALDMGGTNLRVCEITLTDQKSEFDIIQSKYRMPKDLKTGESEELWEYIADCLMQFVLTHHGDPTKLDKLPLGFTFSYPATQNYIDEGILQRWTKGFDINGVEGHNVVPMLEEALERRGVPVKIVALLNDTTGTLMASAYTDTAMKIGCIFGTGCNAAYIEDCGSIPKLAHMNLPPKTSMAINCEWGAFDNEHLVLPRTKYDGEIDNDSPRPGQQSFEKMIAGLYLGEIFRIVLLDLYHNPEVHLFSCQDVTKLKMPYTLDSSFLSAIEDDPFENLNDTFDLFQQKLAISPTTPELELVRRLAELIVTRAARLSACGVAAICRMKGYDKCHVGADGSVFNKSPHFKVRGAHALREILDWPDKTDPKAEDPIEILAAEDGSGVGAALIAALTLKRVNEGNLVGILHPEHFA